MFEREAGEYKMYENIVRREGPYERNITIYFSILQLNF